MGRNSGSNAGEEGKVSSGCFFGICSIPMKVPGLELCKLKSVDHKHLVLPLTKGRNLIVVGKLGIFTGILAKVIRNETRIRSFGGILDLFSPNFG